MGKENIFYVKSFAEVFMLSNEPASNDIFGGVFTRSKF